MGKVALMWETHKGRVSWMWLVSRNYPFGDRLPHTLINVPIDIYNVVMRRYHNEPSFATCVYRAGAFFAYEKWSDAPLTLSQIKRLNVESLVDAIELLK
jgi:hypothetical protein